MERNPHAYADTIASSLAAQTIFAYAPETDRARRVLSKLRQVPRVVQAARDNIKDPPAIFVKVGIETWRGTMSFIDADLPRAFSNIDDLHLLGDLADACTEAVHTIGAYVTDLENDIRPKAKGSFRLGRDSSSRSCGSTKASRCGHPPACGRPGRSKPSRRARSTT